MSFFRFFAGVVGGTALGLLFAKKEGKQLRKELKGKSSKEIAEMIGKEMLAVGKDVADEVKENPEVKKMVKKGTDQAKKAVKNVKEKMVSAEKEVDKTVKKAKTTVKKAVKTVKKATSQ